MIAGSSEIYSDTFSDTLSEIHSEICSIISIPIVPSRAGATFSGKRDSDDYTESMARRKVFGRKTQHMAGIVSVSCTNECN